MCVVERQDDREPLRLLWPTVEEGLSKASRTMTYLCLKGFLLVSQSTAWPEKISSKRGCHMRIQGIETLTDVWSIRVAAKNGRRDVRSIPPYVSFSAFDHLIETFAEVGMPSKVGRMAMTGFSDNVARQLSTACRGMGLTDADGRPTALLRELADARGHRSLRAPAWSPSSTSFTRTFLLRRSME